MAKVYSTHGTLEVNETGKVTGIIEPAKQHWQSVTLDIESIEFLVSIDRFDLEEYAKHYMVSDHNEFDILDLGYWTKSGIYEPPVKEWRKQIEKESKERDGCADEFNAYQKENAQYDLDADGG